MKTHWFVMDSRAAYSTDDASILESCGDSMPPLRELKDLWGGQLAWLCKSVDGKPIELVRMIP